ncbi:MAG: DegT/DnrJ/EryC1/StrS family aminotransferase [Candidatus Binatia bacterium]
MSSPYQIPLVDLRAQYAEISNEVRSAIDEVVESQQFILGQSVTRFETQMATYLNCHHAVGVASGSDALLLALMALNVGPGDAVVTTPFTFFSTVSSITRLGATPLFIDIDINDYLLSVIGVEQLLAERVKKCDGETTDGKTGLRIKALLPVHLFGQSAAMNEFVHMARKYQLRIVEDVAQACGARREVHGEIKFAGTSGDIGCFSFFPSKILGGFGDAGLVSTDSKDLATQIGMLRTHGESAKYQHDLTGINSRLDALQAAVLSIKLKYLETWCAKRIERGQIYHRLFTARGLVGNGVVAIPSRHADKSHVFNNYVIRAERRDELRQFLADNDIQSEVYYPVPLHLQKCFADLNYKRGDFPQAELAASQVLALPLYPELTVDQQETVVVKIHAFYRR